MQSTNTVTRMIPVEMPLVAEFATVTPETAKQWLSLNVNNYRPLNQRFVKSLATDIRARRWKENGESVKFDQLGNLIDGQHRLAACVAANTPFRTLIVRGVGDDINIDTGRRRNLSDVLRRRGEKNYAVLSTALRWIAGYEQDKLRTVIGNLSPPSHQELLATFERHPLLRESVAAVYRAHDLLSLSIAGAFHYMFTLRSDRQSADLFFEKLVTGTDLTNIDPVYQLRQRLLKNAAGKAKLPRMEIAALFVKAWNAWIGGRPVSNLRWRAVGPRAEEFPTFE